MSQCPRCGADNLSNAVFCSKCGFSLNAPRRPEPLVANKAAQPVVQPQRPQRPQPLTASQPQKPMQPMQPNVNNKGIFTDAVRAVANVVTGGQLNRDIMREQERAVAQQANSDRQQIREAQDAEQVL